LPGLEFLLSRFHLFVAAFAITSVANAAGGVQRDRVIELMEAKKERETDSPLALAAFRTEAG
jgi:hypothetical protein